MTCFDTAYVVKCYVKEHGWQQVRALARSSERLACSAFGRLEFHAALHRKLREGTLDGPQLDVILRQLSVDEAARLWSWIPLSTAIMNAVTDTFTRLPGHVYLRTADAVHLLSARAYGCTEIYSNDWHLLQAARHVGMTGRDVIDPPAIPPS
ncbi:MAG: type II toxin-antitoxin system VapC family toxin [Acidobacteria bacterium]|nr:type II toxin-antitoxin system VapC family toxin [Acidobacteriota bacterium]